MITLLLIHSLAARARPVPAANEEPTSSSWTASPSWATSPSCRDINNCRTLWDIIWSCLTTIFLCTWVAIHPNIPEPVHTKKKKVFYDLIHEIAYFMRDKAPLFVCSVLVPEYILIWALRQRLMVRTILKENADLRLTPAHGHFMIMGGFHYFSHPKVNGTTNEIAILRLEAPHLNDPSEAEARPSYPLTHVDVIKMVRNNGFTLPLESEIQDRGNSDGLAKIIIITQTLWFVAQCLARGIQHLPTTELEIVTLAYIAINLGISIAWWDKPRNIDCPIRVFQQPEEQDTAEREVWWAEMFSFIVGVQDRFVNLHRRRKVPLFYSGKPKGFETFFSDMITWTISVLFGAIHCIAWHFEFSSSTQAFLWRLSSAVLTAIPLFPIFAIPALMWLSTTHLNWRLAIPFFFVIPLSGILYIAARLATVVIALMNLSSLPPGAFQSVNWTAFIPHV